MLFGLLQEFGIRSNGGNFRFQLGDLLTLFRDFYLEPSNFLPVFLVDRRVIRLASGFQFFKFRIQVDPSFFYDR